MGFFGAVLPEKGKFCNPTLADITCSRIRTTQPKWLILVSFFSGEDSPSTDTSHFISLLPEVFRSVLFGPPCTYPLTKCWNKVITEILSESIKNFLQIHQVIVTSPGPGHAAGWRSEHAQWRRTVSSFQCTPRPRDCYPKGQCPASGPLHGNLGRALP